MPPKQRIRELCDQLFRVEDPAIIQPVATKLQAAIDEYVRDTTDRTPTIKLTPLAFESECAVLHADKKAA